MVITAEVIRNQTVPANINIFTPDPELPPLTIPREHVKTRVRTALSNSFGFGGHNSSLILREV